MFKALENKTKTIMIFTTIATNRAVIGLFAVVDKSPDNAVVHSLSYALWVHNIFSTVMMRIIVDRNTDHAKPHLIC